MVKISTLAGAAALVAASNAQTSATGNPFTGVELPANPYYANEVATIAIPALQASGKTSLIPAAEAAAQVPSFYWMYVHAQHERRARD